MGKKKVKFYDALAGSTEEELDEFVRVMKKREKIWLILALIPFVNWIFGAFFIRCHNAIRIVSSRGRKQEGGLLNLLIGIWSLIIFPIIMHWIINLLPERFETGVILGVNKLLDQYEYQN